MTLAVPLVRWSSFLAGLLVAAAVLAFAQTDRRPVDSKMDVRLVANLTGQVLVEPTGPVLRARNLEEGGLGVSRRLGVRNITSSPVAVRLRAQAPSRDVDELLHLRASAHGRTLFSGPLRQLRRWTAMSLVLSPGRAAHLRLRAWIPSGESGGFIGRAPDVTLLFSSRRVRG